MVTFKRYARAHLHESPTIGDLARAIGTSERTLQRVMADALGTDRRWVPLAPLRSIVTFFPVGRRSGRPRGQREATLTYTVELFSDRAWPDEQMNALFAEGFPAFITADAEVKKYIARVRTNFPHLYVMLVDEVGVPGATGWGVPISWSGDVDDLPTSFADVLRRSVELADAGADANTFVICGGVVHPGLKGTGMATELIQTLIRTGQCHGMTRVIAPLRPTRKHLYPLFSIADYASWVREDGLAFDPWVRLHVRAGARVIALAPAAQTMTGTVADWQGWVGMPLPATGQYVIPDGMSVLSIDATANMGTYVEPNIWVQHK